MNPLATISVLEGLIRLGTQVQAYSALLAKARAEGRDITDAELQELRAQDDAARDAESAAIAAAKAREGV